jgi:hypothetical protein
VRDRAVKDNDLVAATHGRAFWVLDDVTPLRQMGDSVRNAAVHLFAPATAVRFTTGRSRRDGESGENPMNGVYVDYSLKEKPKGVVKLEFVDAKGGVIRTFTSPDDSEPKKDSLSVAYTASDSLKRLTAYDTTGQSSSRKSIESDSAAYLPADSVVHARQGLNRFVWDLRAPGVRPIKDIINDEGTYDGPMIVPGTYTVRLTANGQTRTRPFTVVDDPRVGATQAELVATYEYTQQVIGKINQIGDQVKRIETMQKQLDDRTSQAAGQPYAKRVSSAAAPLKARLEAIKSELADVHSHADQITLHYPVKLYNQLLNVNRMAESFDRAPTVQAGAVFKDLGGKVDVQLDRLRALESGDISAFNRMLEELKVPAVTVEQPKPIA